MQHDILTRRAACLAQHAGLWCAVPEWLDRTVAAVNRGLLQGRGDFAGLQAENNDVLAALDPDSQFTSTIGPSAPAWPPNWPSASDVEVHVEFDNPAAAAAPAQSRRPYQLDESGIAVIELSGPMMKGRGKLAELLGGANTVELRRAVRAAVADDEVQGILIVVDSPGGMVAGTAELANDIRVAAESKPVRVHADDLMASAAVWATAGAHRITASEATEVGSIGTVLVVHDRSERYATEGVKVHVISTGAHKGAGTPGTELTDEQLDALAARVGDINALFLRAVSDGRGLKGAALDAVSDGRVWIAERAHGLGLIDAVMSMDAAVNDFRSSLERTARNRAARAALVDAELRAAEGRSA